MTRETINIGGASGFWGEASHATGQLLTHPDLDFLIFDYLAEITMSIMARARMKDPARGYAVDFVSDVMTSNIAAIAERGVRVLSNAGGVNPQACADALRDVVEAAGVSLKIAVVTGDDLLARAGDFADAQEMFDGGAFPDAGKIASINAYLGAFPIAAALEAGADIVITGRCADSALALAACIHSFGWRADDVDRLAAGSLAGHLLECGPQSTGGNFTDWREAGNIADIGYPIAEVSADGVMELTKPEGTSGTVTRASVGEQMLYEIGDPGAYVLPDVVCDFTGVRLEPSGESRVRISDAKGRPPTGFYKVSSTFMDGFRAGNLFYFNGVGARNKARAFVEAGLERARRKLSQSGAPDYRETSIQTFGGRPGESDYEEITVKAAVRHDDARAVGLFLKELIGGALATPPGLHFFTAAGRPKPSPVVRLFSFLVASDKVPVAVALDGTDLGYVPPEIPVEDGECYGAGVPDAPDAPDADGEALVTCRLEDLAWARSGDKGDAANIGVIARRPELMAWIWRALDEKTLAATFQPWLKGKVERFYLPGTHAMNILMHGALGGGGIASLLNDPQGKSYAQVLLSVPVDVPERLVEASQGDAV